VEKYCRLRQSADDSMAHMHCMLDNVGYTHTHSLILTPFPPKQWLRERASVLRYAFISCLVFTEQNLVWVVDKNYSISYLLVGF